MTTAGAPEEGYARVKQDFWATMIFFLLFMLFTTGMLWWGRYGTIALVSLISTIVGALVIAFMFRPDRAQRGG